MQLSQYHPDTIWYRDSLQQKQLATKTDEQFYAHTKQAQTPQRLGRSQILNKFLGSDIPPSALGHLSLNHIIKILLLHQFKLHQQIPSKTLDHSSRHKSTASAIKSTAVSNKHLLIFTFQVTALLQPTEVSHFLCTITREIFPEMDCKWCWHVQLCKQKPCTLLTSLWQPLW